MTDRRLVLSLGLACVAMGPGCGQDPQETSRVRGSAGLAAGCQAPAGWECDPAFYGSDDGCDCECGLPDPDCTGGTNDTLYGCGAGQVCREGSCEERDFECSCDPSCVFDGSCCGRDEECPVPDGWTCDAGYYASDDGCDCECGAPDPDCTSDPDEYVYGCDAGQQCTDGRCEECEDCGGTCGDGVCNGDEDDEWCCEDCGCRPDFECNDYGQCECTSVIVGDCGVVDPGCGEPLRDLGDCADGMECVDNTCE